MMFFFFPFAFLLVPLLVVLLLVALLLPRLRSLFARRREKRDPNVIDGELIDEETGEEDEAAKG